MKTLQLYDEPSQVLLLGHYVSQIVPGKPRMTDLRFLEREIARWLESPERGWQIDGERYYDGEHDILQRKRMVIGENGALTEVKNIPNNRLVDNQYAKMLDQKANYLCGKVMTFDTKSETFGNELTKFFSRKRQRMIKRLAEYALMGGKSWLFPFYTPTGDLAFALFRAHEILPFWADNEHTELDCAIHFFPIWEYDEDGHEKIIHKVEVMHGGGIDRFIWNEGSLKPDTDAPSGPYLTVSDEEGKTIQMNWDKSPLICFKYNNREIPLIQRVKGLQDALNTLISDFVNNMEEDVHNTILVLKNYDGENLGTFRRNLATYGAVKVRTVDGAEGGVDKLTIEVNAENYKVIEDALKAAIIENARGYDAKRDKLGNSPNEMNIQSMYSDIDLDADGMETEFQAAFEELLWCVCVYLKNAGKGDYLNEDVDVIFNRDVLINETEAIDNCGKSVGIISNETIVKQHPWVDNPEKELERLAAEKAEAAKQADVYRAAFESTVGSNNEGNTALNEEDEPDLTGLSDAEIAALLDDYNWLIAELERIGAL